MTEGWLGASGHTFSANGECRRGAGSHLEKVVPQGCSEEMVLNMSLGGRRERGKPHLSR